MSSIGTWLWGTSQLDDAIDKATSELLPSGAEDIALNLEICDQIRSKSVPARDAMRALKRRLNHKNPNVQLLALGLTDVCIKNGGDQFLTEAASREFMDNLVSILKIPVLNNEVKDTILRLIQNWSVAFEGKPSLSYVGQVYKTLTNEGYKFPPKDLAVANSAMVDSQTAPEWIDSDVCLRCRTAFSFTNRKHHCRNCGQVFDQQCSAKSMPLPHFGITQEVRVCDGCHAKLSKKNEKLDKGHRHSTSLHGTRHRNARELADAELQRAIQLSLQEAGAASGHARPGYVPSQPSPAPWQYSEPPLVDRSTHPVDTKYHNEEEEDPDLKAAIEASLREANAPKPSAPVALDTPRTEEPGFALQYSQSYPPGVLPPQPSLPKLPNYDLEPMESDAILTFSQTVEQVQAQGGRDLSRYPAVNELYDKANSLRPKLAMSLDDTGRKEEMLSDMHDKLSQAVKLYDQLLTEQVTHPRWRSPHPVASSPYQQANSRYSTGYNTVNGYTQWAPQAQTTSPAYQVPSEPPRQPQSPQVAHSPPVQEYQAQYGNTPRVETTQPQWHQHQQQQPQYAEPAPPAQQQQPPYTQQSTQYSTTPLSPSQFAHAQPSPPSQQHRQQPQYAEPPQPTQQQPYVQQNTQYSTPVPPASQFVHAQPSSSPQQQRQSQYAEPPPPPSQQQLYTQPSTQYSTTPISAASQIHHVQPSSSLSQSQHTEPSHYHQQQYAAETPTSIQQPSVSYNASQSLPSAPLAASPQTTPGQPSSVPAVSVQSPPPAQYATSLSQPSAQKPNLPSSTSLTRHNTITYASSNPQATSTHAFLSRSNTVAHPPSHLRQHQPQQQQQHQQYASSPPPPSTLPNFPVVPTSAPQTFSMYGSSIPSGIAQTEERKEALLIDL